jgi:hypothetical protein
MVAKEEKDGGGGNTVNKGEEDEEEDEEDEEAGVFFFKPMAVLLLCGCGCLFTKIERRCFVASENPFGRAECSNCFLFFFCFSLLCFTFPPLELLQVPGRKCTLCFLFLVKGSIGIIRCSDRLLRGHLRETNQVLVLVWQWLKEQPFGISKCWVFGCFQLLCLQFFMQFLKKNIFFEFLDQLKSKINQISDQLCHDI